MTEGFRKDLRKGSLTQRTHSHAVETTKSRLLRDPKRPATHTVTDAQMVNLSKARKISVTIRDATRDGVKRRAIAEKLKEGKIRTEKPVEGSQNAFTNDDPTDDAASEARKIIDGF